MLWLIRGARRKLTGSLVFFFKKLYLFIFTWLMIILQYWFDFCYTQHELAIGIHMSPPSWTFLPPPTLSRPSRLLQFEFPESYGRFPLAIYFTYYVHPCYCLHSSHPFNRAPGFLSACAKPGKHYPVTPLPKPCFLISKALRTVLPSICRWGCGI